MSVADTPSAAEIADSGSNAGSLRKRDDLNPQIDLRTIQPLPVGCVPSAALRAILDAIIADARGLSVFPE